MGLASARIRPRLVGALGERGYAGLYSLVSLALFVPLVWVYFGNKHAGPLFWYLGGVPGVHGFMYAGAAFAFALMVAGLVTPSPTFMGSREANVRGVFRITRHPLFMGVGLLGALHLLVAVVNATELVFFAGLIVFSLIGCYHQDRRKLLTDDAFRQFHDATPFLPGGGRGALRGVAEQPIPLMIGVALAALVRYFHGSLFG
jgi:uncharacterized membrane protein